MDVKRGVGTTADTAQALSQHLDVHQPGGGRVGRQFVVAGAIIAQPKRDVRDLMVVSNTVPSMAHTR